MAASLGISPSRARVESREYKGDSREGLQADCQFRVAEAGSWGRRQFENPGEGECPPFEATTKQRSEDRDWEHLSVCDSDL
jgi:hypothetical protein